MVHFLSVSQFGVFINEAHNCSVIRILDDMVGDVIRRAVICHQGEQQGAQNAALWATSVQGDDTRVVFFQISAQTGFCLREKSSSKLHRDVLRPKGPNLHTRSWQLIMLNAEHIGVLLLQLLRAQMESSGDSILCEAVGLVCEKEWVR